jgi:hypothetical protein
MRLVPLLGAVLALSALPAANAVAALSRCPDEDTFVVAVYVHGGSCHQAYAVISRWNADGCKHKAQPCAVTYDWGGHWGRKTFECHSIARVDHMSRHYYAISCLTADRTGDVRARDYPHGDYKPG